MQLLNKLLIVLAAAALIVVATFWCIQTIFSSSSNLNDFLVSAKTYQALNVVVGDQLLVDLQADQASAAIQGATKTVLTPDLTQNLLRPGLNSFVDWLQKPAPNTPLIVRLDLRQFKEALAEQLSGDTTAANAAAIHFQTVASVPDSAVLVDDQPASANTRHIFESLKTIYIKSREYFPVALAVTGGLMGLLTILSLGSLGRIVRRLSWPFVLAGGVLTTAGWLAPWVIQQFFLKGATPTAQTAPNFIAAGFAGALLGKLLVYGYGLAAIGIVGVVIAATVLRPPKHKRKRHGH